MLVTVSQTTLSPTIQVIGDTIELRVWYTDDFIGGDGVTPIRGGPDFYYSVTCSKVGSQVVIPAFTIQATTESNPTADFFGQLYVNGAAGKVIFGGDSGWQMPTIYGSTLNYGQLAAYNRVRRLLSPPDTYFTADETIREILLLAGAQNYAGVGILGRTQLDTAPDIASEPIAVGINSPLLTGGGTVYNVKNYGAVGDNVANDVVAFRACVAAVNAAGGGVIEIPKGTFKLQVGDTATDTNYTVVAGYYSILNITAPNITMRLAPDAVVRVVATWVSQNAAGSSTATPQALFYIGDGTNPIRNFCLEGTGKLTWEAAAPAVLLEVLNGTNDFHFLESSFVDGLIMRDVTIDGFTRGGLFGGIAVGADTIGNVLMDHTNVTNYGGSGHDNWFYYQGGSRIINNRFVSTRTYQSHAIYFGADRPYNHVESNYFEGIDTASKYAIHCFGSGGTKIYAAWIDQNVFVGCHPLIVEHNNPAERFHITNNKVYWNDPLTNTGFLIHVGTQFEIANNEFYNIGTAINADGLRKSVISNTTHINGVSTVVLSTSLAASDGLVVSNTLCDNVTGPAVNFVGVTDSMVSHIVHRNPTSNSICVQIGGTSARVTIDHARIYSATSGYAGVWIASGAPDEIAINNCQFDVPSYSLDLQLGTNITVQNCILKSGFVRFFSGLTGPCTISGNRFGAATTAIFDGPTTALLNNIIPNGFSTTAGVTRAQGNLIAGALDTVSPAYATPYTPNAGLYRTILMGTLTGAITINAPTNPYSGAELEFVFTQDGTGARVVTWNAAFKVNWTPDTTAGKVNTIKFQFNGTSWLQTAAATGL